MNKIRTCLFVAISICATAAYAGLPALSSYTFAKGDKIASLSIGVGSGSGATFGQQLSMEWCIAGGWIDNRASLGLGFAINNALCGKYDTFLVGTYDYTYQHTTYHYNIPDWMNLQPVYHTTQHRSGQGSTWAEVQQDNLAAMVTCSFHFQFIDRLDIYATVGLGIGFNFRAFDYYNSDGFKKADVDKTYGSRPTTRDVYSYDDFEHAQWSNAIKSFSLCPAASSLVGARWYFTDSFAAQAELGMIGACFTTGTSYTILSFGATLKF